MTVPFVAEGRLRIADFYIGLEFCCGPFWWRCTDVGSRTVVAIRLVERDSRWYVGPPYMVEESVFDEAEISRAYLTEEDRLRAAVLERGSGGHPGYLHEDVCRMTNFRLESRSYPRKSMLRFDRVRGDGEILHPYAARKVGADWFIRFFMPFVREWGEMLDFEFALFAVADATDVRRRADRRL